MIAVTGHPVGSEGDDRVRPDVLDEVRYLTHPVGRRDQVQLPVMMAEPMMFPDSDCGQTLGEFPLARPGQPMLRPSLRVAGSQLTLGRSRDDNALTAGRCGIHETG